MKTRVMNDKGFSLTELMFAMTILAVGLLAMAQMQIMSIRGTAESKDFSTATNLAKEGVEALRPPNMFPINSGNSMPSEDIGDMNTGNNSDSDQAPTITTTTDIQNDIAYDYIEVLKESDDGTSIDAVCGPVQYPLNCNSAISAGDWDFVRVTNIRNLPDGPEYGAIMKDVNLIVLWKDGALTRSLSVRTMIAGKDVDFF